VRETTLLRLEKAAGELGLPSPLVDVTSTASTHHEGTGDQRAVKARSPNRVRKGRA